MGVVVGPGAPPSLGQEPGPPSSPGDGPPPFDPPEEVPPEDVPPDDAGVVGVEPSGEVHAFDAVVPDPHATPTPAANKAEADKERRAVPRFTGGILVLQNAPARRMTQ